MNIRTLALALSILLGACPAFAQTITGIAWNPSTTPGASYIVSVDGKSIGAAATAATDAAPFTWTPTGSFHTVCVTAVAGTVQSTPSCINYGTPPQPSNQPPTVVITSPAGGSSVVSPVTIHVTATDPDGSIAQVQCFRNGGGFPQALLGTDTTAPYECAWSQSALGSWSLTAVATDNGGLSATSVSVAVTLVSTPPTPPPAPAPTFSVAPKICTLTDSKPDARTGWGVQFKADGVNVGGRDTTVPYSRDLPYVPGPRLYEAVWTKTGVPSVTRTITTQGCQ